MKKLLIISLVLLPLWATAQVRFGYLRYQFVLQQMPEYIQSQKDLTDLKAKYDKEATHNEEEFQRKFTDFLQGQKEFPQNILIKRQTELQELMNNAVKFREECQQLLTQAEKDMVDGLTHKLDSVIEEVGLDNGYAFVLNTDDHNCPFVNPVLGDNIAPLVLRKMGMKSDEPVEITRPAIEEPQPADEIVVPIDEQL